MAKRRKGKSKHYKKDLEGIKKSNTKIKKRSHNRLSSHKYEASSKSGRISKKRKEDIIFFTVLFIIIASIFGGYFVYDIYLKEGEEGTDSSSTSGGSSNNGGSSDNGAVSIGINVGQTAPDFELTDTEGIKFSLNDYREYIVILDFMADRCPPCHDEMDHLNEVHSNYYSKGVRIISIGVDDSETAEQLITNVQEKHNCDWRFAAGGGNVGNTYQIQYIPTIFILDKEGNIAYKNTGLTDYSTLKLEIDKII